jgi:hypothetical protein
MPKTKKGFNALLFGSLMFFLLISVFSRWTYVNRVNLLTAGCQCFDFTGDIDASAETAIYNGKKIAIPQLAFASEPINVLGSTSEQKWIEVDLSDQKLYAWDGSSLFMESKISSGLPLTPTPIGEFRIWIKLRATRMQGGSGRYYYNLPNVPHTMFFANESVPTWKGYGIHGAYWHNEFGTQRSHGCVNLPLDSAKTLYYWATPELPDGKGSIRANAENPGTRVVIHQ